MKTTKEHIHEKFKENDALSISQYYYFLSFAFFIQNTGNGILLLLMIVPIICFIVSIIYGINHSFHWLYGGMTILLFVPTIFIFYNESAVIYTVIYGALAFMGNWLGANLYK